MSRKKSHTIVLYVYVEQLEYTQQYDVKSIMPFLDYYHVQFLQSAHVVELPL